MSFGLTAVGLAGVAVGGSERMFSVSAEAEETSALKFLMNFLPLRECCIV